MSDKPVIHSEELGNTEYDGNRRTRTVQEEAAPAAEKPKIEPVAGADETAVAQRKAKV